MLSIRHSDLGILILACLRELSDAFLVSGDDEFPVMCTINVLIRINVDLETDLRATIHILKSSMQRHLIWNVAVLESMWISFRPGAVDMAACCKEIWSRTG